MSRHLKRYGVGVVLAVLGGTLGLHRFYLDDRRAWWYVAFCWTGIPTLAGLLEAASVPRRIRIYEAERQGQEAQNLRWVRKRHDP